MNKETVKAVGKRALRVGVATAIGVVFSHFTKDPRYILLTPVISALGKWLRKVFDLPNIPF